MGTWVTKTQKYFCRKKVKMAHLGRTKVTVICYEVTVICYDQWLTEKKPGKPLLRQKNKRMKPKTIQQFNNLGGELCVAKIFEAKNSLDFFFKLDIILWIMRSFCSSISDEEIQEYIPQLT